MNTIVLAVEVIWTGWAVYVYRYYPEAFLKYLPFVGIVHLLTVLPLFKVYKTLQKDTPSDTYSNYVETPLDTEENELFGIWEKTCVGY